MGDADDAARREALEQINAFEPRVVAAAGASATSILLEAMPETPIVFFMVPNALDAAFVSADKTVGRCVGGVSSDPSPADQIEWVRKTQPSCRRIAIPHSDRCGRTAQALAEAAQRASLGAVQMVGEKDKFPALLEALNDSNCDGVLMIPDGQLYNAPNVQQLLLWGVRNKRPIWTFSENIVKAGAFSGQSCDADAVARAAADMVAKVIAADTPPKLGVEYAATPARSVNVRTGEMIGVPLTGAVADVVRFGEQERAP